MGFLCFKNGVGYARSIGWTSNYNAYTIDDGLNWSPDTSSFRRYQVEASNSSLVFMIDDYSALWKTSALSASVAVGAHDTSYCLYPNPASDYLYVQGGNHVQVIDLLGRILPCEVEKNNERIRVNVRRLENGTYFLTNGTRFVVDHSAIIK